ncbi:MAG: hypothetical protein WC916_00675 [Candidatus Woesearchaeota archaeon]
MGNETDDTTENKNALVGTKHQENSLALNVLNYSNVSAQRAKDENDIESLGKALDVEVKEASKSAYGGQNGLIIIGQGIRHWNLPMIKNGLKKITGRRISLSDILKAQYEGFCDSRDRINDRVSESKQSVAGLHANLVDNAKHRVRLGEELKAHYSNITKYNDKIFALEKSKNELNPNAENYTTLVANADLSLAQKRQELMNETTNYNIKSGQSKIEKETYDLFTILAKEAEAGLPHLIILHETVKGRVNQADAVIQYQSKAITTAETVMDAVKTYGEIKATLEYSNNALALFNENFSTITGYIANTPLIDEKSLANRVNSIRILNEDTNRYQSQLASVNGNHEFGEMNLADCYSFLGCEITAKPKEIDEARKNMLLNKGLHPDMKNADLSVEEQSKLTRKVEYCANVTSTFAQMGDNPTLRKLIGQ